jgi:hypothetical protein
MRQTSITPAGFEPTLSADQRPQTYALDRASNETGKRNMSVGQLQKCLYQHENCMTNHLFRQLRKTAKKGRLASSYLSVCPSVYVEQLGFRWTDFHKNKYFHIFRKSAEIFKIH